MKKHLKHMKRKSANITRKLRSPFDNGTNFEFEKRLVSSKQDQDTFSRHYPVQSLIKSLLQIHVWPNTDTKIKVFFIWTASSTKRYGRSTKVYRKHVQSRDREDGARANRFITDVCPTNARHTSPQDMVSLHWAGALHRYVQLQSCSPLRSRLEFR